MIEIIHTNNAPEPIGPYNQAVKANGFVFISGQLAIEMESGNLITDDIKKETKIIFNNINNILTAGGSSLDKIVKVTVFIRDISRFTEVNSIYSNFFQKNAPARAVVESSGLPKNANLEIECVALA